ncbi:hypothetical protein CKALI_11415 [Corynebacterium kalinowskii]|uniref:Uncharacterized protein n=1 Tax=Corynebacterium kalinowskii TaxID=2675216 RepID=A0A6B8VU16_9CORY|nr:hypothetical protein [Corynebacterium kalinowskii]QGU03127.1 hypothetical protein CKALI_11415 [Corynebacterium kalinowskii]
MIDQEKDLEAEVDDCIDELQATLTVMWDSRLSNISGAKEAREIVNALRLMVDGATMRLVTEDQSEIIQIGKQEQTCR